MRQTERREVIRKEVADVTVRRYCDNCGGEIAEVRSGVYNYFVITTHHHDWGNDSVDSYERYDACCPGCATDMVREYLEIAYNGQNTKEIEVAHVSGLDDGTDDDHRKDIARGY